MEDACGVIVGVIRIPHNNRAAEADQHHSRGHSGLTADRLDKRERRESFEEALHYGQVPCGASARTALETVGAIIEIAVPDEMRTVFDDIAVA